MEDYIPKILNGKHGTYVEMLVQCYECPICGKKMIKRDKGHYLYSLFPLYYKMNQKTQAKNAQIVFVGTARVDDEVICEECEASGKAYFICQLCGEKKSTDKIQESISSPADFLCKDCFETVTAKVWDEKCEELKELHRYDFE